MAFVSKNIFDLLGDNDAPAAAQAPKPAAKKADAPAPSARAVPGAAPRGGARGGRPSGNRPAHTTTRDNRVADNEGAETASGFDGERAPANKKANHVRDAHTKGPRGGRQNKTSGGHTSSGAGHYKGGKVVAQAGERRQFDRKNASGTTDSAKKTEHGWGATTGAAELKDEVAGEKDAQAEETAPQTPAEDTAAAPEPEAEEEPEEVTKSYEEYLAEKAEESARLANLGKKQGREVSGDVEGKAFVREALDDFFSGKTKTAETKSKPKKEKVHIAIDGQFAQPSRPPAETTERTTASDVSEASDPPEAVVVPVVLSPASVARPEVVPVVVEVADQPAPPSTPTTLTRSPLWALKRITCPIIDF